MQSSDFEAIDLCTDKMEKLGISPVVENLGTYDQNQTRSQESRLQDIERCNGFLVHACQCIDANCRLSSCPKMKRLIQHARSCAHQKKGYGCPVCEQLILLCRYHAKYCQDATCSVFFCLIIKEKGNTDYSKLLK